MAKYLNFNGELNLTEKPCLGIDNRALNYGDGFFETIRCLSSKPLFFHNHYQRLLKSMQLLKMELPSEWTEHYFQQQIFKLLQRNRIYKGARVRLTVFRKSGGLYTPTLHTPLFIISASFLENEYFNLNKKGVKVGIYTEEYKPINRLSSIKSCSALYYVLAGMWKKENRYDDCLLVNERGKIMEALSSNLFLVKDNVIYTPSITSGCVEGTMRRTILDIFRSGGMQVVENKGFDEQNLRSADEVFLTNAIQGVLPVSGYLDRRYYHNVASGLVNNLNQVCKDIHG